MYFRAVFAGQPAIFLVAMRGKAAEIEMKGMEVRNMVEKVELKE